MFIKQCKKENCAFFEFFYFENNCTIDLHLINNMSVFALLTDYSSSPSSLSTTTTTTSSSTKKNAFNANQFDFSSPNKDKTTKLVLDIEAANRFIQRGLASAQGLSLKAWREARKQAKENGEEIGMPRPARTPLSRRRPKKQNVKSMIVRRSKRIIQQQRQSSSYKPITNISHKMISGGINFQHLYLSGKQKRESFLEQKRLARSQSTQNKININNNNNNNNNNNHNDNNDDDDNHMSDSNNIEERQQTPSIFALMCGKGQVLIPLESNR